ncbi:tetratricopeptide repeat protein [Streptomyces griseorubiginosus]|uniref:tetratricopeptide repeat protein n=1 Tax=Streptomyces griseorubiginosus TaxID=67304 RepID=UPI0011405551|nr:tetratricopeptide repeat protein [Streptomyces griseorubiginosus]
MGVVRILLPLPRAAAKWAPEKGGPLLGAALSYCVTPSWAGLPPPSPARRLAWAEEAVAVYRATADTAGLSRALALRAHALLLSGRFEEANGAADEAMAVRGAGPDGDAGGPAAVRAAPASRAADGPGPAGGVRAGAGADRWAAAGTGAEQAAVAGTGAGEAAAVRGVPARAGADQEAAPGTGLDEVAGAPGARAGTAAGGRGEVSAAVGAFLADVRAQALAGLGRAEEAVPVARASVAAYRRLPAPDRRDRALGSLPGALRTYGMLLATTGRREEAVAVYEECAALLAAMSLRELAHVERVRPQVLAELVGVLRASGRYEDALGVGPEAREALRGPLAWTVPETVLPLRVRLLVDLARCHTATGDPAEARACAQAAVAEARKPHGAGELTSALDCLADVLGELGHTAKESITRRERAELRDT